MIDDPPLAFSSGDCNPGNFLSDGARLTGIVDFALACFEDPHIGFAKYRMSIATSYRPLDTTHNRKLELSVAAREEDWIVVAELLQPRPTLIALRSLASDVVPELFAGLSRAPGSAGLDRLVAIAQKLLGIQEQEKENLEYRRRLFKVLFRGPPTRLPLKARAEACSCVSRAHWLTAVPRTRDPNRSRGAEPSPHRPPTTCRARLFDFLSIGRDRRFDRRVTQLPECAVDSLLSILRSPCPPARAALLLSAPSCRSSSSSGAASARSLPAANCTGGPATRCHRAWGRL